MIRVRFPVGRGLFLFAATTRLALGPTQPRIQRGNKSYLPRGKGAGELISPLTSPRLRMRGDLPPLPHLPVMNKICVRMSLLRC